MAAAPGNRHPGEITSSATIEIQGVSKQFRTRAVAAADILFIPLITSAKRAMAIADEVAKANSQPGAAALVARTYLVGMMMEDPSFVISANLPGEENKYILDVEKGAFYSRTWINAAHENRTLLMQAETVGNIKEGLYEVRDIRTKTTLVQFSEQDAQQADFFAKVLPERCIVEMIQRERTGGLGGAVGAVAQQVQLTIHMQVGGASVLIGLQQDGPDTPWDVYDGRTKIKLGTLPAGETDSGRALIDEVIAFLKAGHRHFLDGLPLNARRGAFGSGNR